MQLIAMRPPRKFITMSARTYENAFCHAPHSFSGASQVTVVDPLEDEVRIPRTDINICCAPVVPGDGDGGAAQPDGNIKATEINAEEAGDGRSGGTGRGDDAGAALRGGRGSDRRRGSAVGHGGSKGLKCHVQCGENGDAP
jgi:hypothetical protein